MTESNNYCKKNPAEYIDFELAIIRVRIGTFESESQLDLEHWENESRARVRALRSETADHALGMIVCQYHDRQHFHPA